MNDGRSIPHEPDVPRPSKTVERFGGDGRVHKRSVYAGPSTDLSGISNAVRRDHRRLQKAIAARDVPDTGLPDWMQYAQADRHVEDGTIAFPAPRTESSPGLDYLGRPTGRRRGGRR